MNIVHIVPGAGKMYCGNCFRDNALVASLRKMGHSVLMLPLYLPLTLDEEDQSAGTPIFFSGVNVYLEQKSSWFRKAPKWLHGLLASRPLLRWAAGRTAKTRPDDLGELTLSMLRGEEGNQARELDELIGWLKTQPPVDIVCLSNVLLAGLARRIKRELRVPVITMLQGEDSFLDSLPSPHRSLVWTTLAERAAELDLCIAPSEYFANLMQRRLRLPPERVRVVHNGINLTGFSPAEKPPEPPAVGFFARMCPEKGLDLLVDAFILLKERNRVPGLTLRVGGSCGPADQPFVDKLRSRLAANGLLEAASFHPNLDRTAKLAFLRSLSVFSVPAPYGEAFGLYLLEAWATGVPVVQPREAAFPELIAATQGGLLFEPNNPASLAGALEELLLNPERSRTLGTAAREKVLAHFPTDRMTRDLVELYREATTRAVAAAA